MLLLRKIKKELQIVNEQIELYKDKVHLNQRKSFYEQQEVNMEQGWEIGLHIIYASIFLFTSFASIGLPGLNGFVGEFMILMGSYPTFKVLTSFAAFGVVLAAIYMLWAYQRMFNGQLDNDENSVLTDLNSKELVAISPLLALMLFIGIYPSFIESYVVQDVSVIYESISNLIGVSQ